MMKQITKERDYENMLARVYDLMQKDVQPDSKESDEFEVLSLLIKDYESVVYSLVGSK